MEVEQHYRHELKFSITYSDYLSLRMKLRPIMTSDSNTDENGKYSIHSIYFDNYNDKVLREKLDGTARREKFRIRFYNNNLAFIKLEKKMKINNLYQKFSATITEAECRNILEGDINWMLDHHETLVQELYVKMKYQQICPRVFVSYIREPYTFKAGNVRVTFDSNIRTSLFCRSFLEERSTEIEIADKPGMMLLEVKYDEYFPDIIGNLIQTNNCRREAMSKYGASRRFG